jgi:uncharacterized protein
VFKLEQREIREEGLAISGEIANEIFLLPEGDPITPKGPVRYDARAYVIEGDLIIEGEFAADFLLECSRCLEKFEFSVKLHAHQLTENLENPTEADLTEAVREDILLALPVYPQCEEGNIPRTCPAEGKFDTSNRSSQETEAGSDEEAPNPWAALDKIDGLDKQSDS